MDTRTSQIIGINALFLIPNGVGGTEYHLRSFVTHLQKMDTQNNYIIFCNAENYDSFTCTEKNWQKVLCPVKASNRILRIVYEQTLFPLLVQTHKCTILHSYGYFGPLYGHFKKIVTVHDCNWLDHPEDTPRMQNLLLNFLISRSIVTSDVVITDSEFSLTRLHHYYPQQKNKMIVIQPGVDDSFIELLKNELPRPLPEKYLLCVSALYPHKKMLYLLDLWEQFSLSSNLHLVVVGQHGADEQAFLQKLNTLSRVHYFKKVDYPTLVALYKHAELFIFPSVYEGFGFPVYEAYTAKNKLLVGKKSLYDNGIHSSLVELSFDIQNDNQLLTTTLKNNIQRNMVNTFSSYTESTEKLIQSLKKI